MRTNLILMHSQVLKHLFARFQTDVDFFQRDAEDVNSTNNQMKIYQHIYLDLLEQ